MDNAALLQHWQQLQGQSLGTSDWLQVEQQRIDAFADATMDYQVIHIDPQADATKKIGGTIAHGFLTLSLLSYLIESLTRTHTDNRTVLNYGLNRVRFLQPVPGDASIRLHASVKEVTDKSNGVLVTIDNTVDIQGQATPAMVAEKLILVLYH
ncbi:MAG: MaoC family dehydratase [Pseudomonadota bacterium]